MSANPAPIPQAPLPDLTTCEREPIHTPGHIQPCGVLLATSPGSRAISHVSANCASAIGLSAWQILGTDLCELVGAAAFATMQAALSDPAHPHSPVLDLTLPIPVGARRRVVVHRHQDRWIVELEDAPARDDEAADLSRAQHVIASLRQARTVSLLCEGLARQMRRLVGYDRVMVYRFDEAGHGTVIAEDRSADLRPFLHMRFPASDIPPQARRLYRLQRVRFVCDVHYTPVDVLAADGTELDMTFCGLRGISPVHLEYLRNLGVAASLSISLLHDDRLWGLIACHHRTPKQPGADMRALCDMMGQVASVLLQRVAEAEGLATRLERFAIAGRIREDIDATESVLTGLCRDPARLLDLVGAGGAFIRSDGTQRLIGQTPPADRAGAMVDALLRERHGAIASVSDAGLPGGLAAGAGAEASGILVMPLPNTPGDVVAWFRPGLVRTVTWAGDPAKPVIQHPDGPRLSPRQSFAAWTEQVRGHSAPWTPADLQAAEVLHRAVTGARLRLAERQLAHLSAFDPLTGIANRRTVEAALRQWREERSPDEAALMFFDIDRFKAINDTLGHRAGDQCLVEIAARLRRLAPPGSLPGRLGGDEFVLFWPAAPREDCAALARRLIEAYAIPFDIDGRPYFSSASIGIAYGDHRAFDEMMPHADAAMYAAKRDGGGKAVFFQPDLHRAVLTGMQTEQELFHALNADEIKVFYQPIVRLADGVTVGFEALARWQHPRRGIVLPGEFIASAEESGLILRLGAVVMADALGRVGAWRKLQPGLTVSVNVCARQLTDAGFAAWLLDAVAKAEVEPAWVCLEVTESVLLNPAAIACLTGLRGRGFLIGIDDFGTGHSSLSYLQRLPADIVKVDRSFVAPLGNAQADRFFSAIVELARTFDLRVIAEGCETEEQWRAIGRAGCDAAQGWLMAPALDPITADRFVMQKHRGAARPSPDTGPAGRLAPRMRRTIIGHDAVGGRDAFFAAMTLSRMPMTLVDPHQPDMPIVFANEAFERLTGYGQAEILGRNCRFLQGAETAPEAVRALRQAVAEGREIAVELVNYRRDGTSFWNVVHVSPVFDTAGRLVYFFGSQTDITRRKRTQRSLAGRV
jgi:diguanylate cyclase (GGDEF)-like protein/PAS domain S-box-containing protein